MSDLSIQSVDESEIDTVLAEDIDFQGKLTFSEPLMIKGRFSGEIQSTNNLYIGKDAVVKAQIEADLVSLKGKVKGNVKAHERVELFSSASVDGDISAPNMVMESGCRINGMCRMQTDGADKK
jgi:cytoskeletal protein CcmA (bactofilin family)